MQTRHAPGVFQRRMNADFVLIPRQRLAHRRHAERRALQLVHRLHQVAAIGRQQLRIRRPAAAKIVGIPADKILLLALQIAEPRNVARPAHQRPAALAAARLRHNRHHRVLHIKLIEQVMPQHAARIRQAIRKQPRPRIQQQPRALQRRCAQHQRLRRHTVLPLVPPVQEVHRVHAPRLRVHADLAHNRVRHNRQIARRHRLRQQQINRRRQRPRSPPRLGRRHAQLRRRILEPLNTQRIARLVQRNLPIGHLRPAFVLARHAEQRLHAVVERR